MFRLPFWRTYYRICGPEISIDNLPILEAELRVAALKCKGLNPEPNSAFEGRKPPGRPKNDDTVYIQTYTAVEAIRSEHSKLSKESALRLYQNRLRKSKAGADNALYFQKPAPGLSTLRRYHSNGKKLIEARIADQNKIAQK